MDSGSRKTFSNLFSRQTVPLKNTPQVTVVSRSGGVDPNKTLFPIQPDPRRGSKRALNQVIERERVCVSLSVSLKISLSLSVSFSEGASCNEKRIHQNDRFNGKTKQK
jgi:hypothetical protein